jgi:hypothetical protein
VEERTAAGAVRVRWRHTYGYDSHGNWVKRTTDRWSLLAGETDWRPWQVERRTITYY